MKNNILIYVYKDGMEIKSWDKNSHPETQIVLYDKQFKRLAWEKALHFQDEYHDTDIVVFNYLRKTYYVSLDLQ